MTTAKEYLSGKKVNIKGSDKPYDQFSRYEVESMLIEFARIHVTKALGEASKKATANVQYDDFDGTHDAAVSKESILIAYPLENIK